MNPNDLSVIILVVLLVVCELHLLQKTRSSSPKARSAVHKIL